MVSLDGTRSARPSRNISKVASMLDADESHVTLLLEEGRLTGTLLSDLRRRGVEATPAVKNSVQKLVRTLEAERSPPEPEVIAVASAHASDAATSTIVFTDMVDSSAMMQRLGDRVGKVVLGVHEEIVRKATAQHEGSVVKAMGDGFMLVFHSVRRAVACAIAVQRAVARYNSDEGVDPLSVRIGLSVGEPISDGADLYGLSVVMAARVASRADGGQILVSEIVNTLVSPSGEFEFIPAGSARLKGLDGDHLLFEAVWA